MTTDILETALHTYRERLTNLLDMTPEDEAHSIMATEAAFIWDEGPAAYIAFLPALDGASVINELDVHLDDVLDQILTDGSES